MAEIRSGDADRFSRNPPRECRLFLLFGPDAGLVSERADALATSIAAASGIDLTDPFSLVRMDADLTAESGRLADEAHTIAMFGGSRLIRVSGTTRRNLVESVRAVVEHPPVDCSVIIEAGDIKRDSALRKLVEKAPATSAAIACYPDDDAALERMIDAQLATHGLSIGPAARTALRHRLGEDRRANRNEIDKLALYCLGQTSVSEADVTAACGDMGEMAVDELIDAAAIGNSAETARQLSRMQAGGIAPDMAMLTMMRHFQMLQAARYQVEDKRLSAPAVIGSLRPPLHFSRRDAVTQALAAWNMPALQKALALLEEAAFECRAKPALGQSLASAATWAIAIEASRLRRGRV